jgi:hypothetical protein
MGFFILGELILFFFDGTAVWTQGFVLVKQSPFYSGYFGGEVSWSICLGWPWTENLKISVSSVSKITGMTYQGLADITLMIIFKVYRNILFKYQATEILWCRFRLNSSCSLWEFHSCNCSFWKAIVYSVLNAVSGH